MRSKQPGRVVHSVIQVNSLLKSILDRYGLDRIPVDRDFSRVVTEM